MKKGEDRDKRGKRCGKDGVKMRAADPATCKVAGRVKEGKYRQYCIYFALSFKRYALSL